MEIVAVVIALALLEFVVFGMLVGRARGRYGVNAPAVSGHEIFDRYFRVHYNTMEMLVTFVPSIWLFGLYVSPQWARRHRRRLPRWPDRLPAWLRRRPQEARDRLRTERAADRRAAGRGAMGRAAGAAVTARALQPPERAVSRPASSSTSARANSIEVPGPRDVITVPSTTTAASLKLRPGAESGRRNPGSSSRCDPRAGPRAQALPAPRRSPPCTGPTAAKRRSRSTTRASFFRWSAPGMPPGSTIMS